MVERIAAAVCRSGPRRIVEVGPGKGVLTQRLLATGADVIAIELDPAMVAILRERFPDHPCLTLVEADVLTVDLAQWGPAVLAGDHAGAWRLQEVDRCTTQPEYREFISVAR